MLVTDDTNPERNERADGGASWRWPRLLGDLWYRLLERARAQDGFTLVEALMAAVILVVGLIGLLGLLDASVKASAITRAREGATNLAREIIEDARTIPYAQIMPDPVIENQLQAMSSPTTPPTYPLKNSTPGSGWHIERRGFTYTVKVEECAIDDPKDGLAKTHGSTFCAGQPNGTGSEEDTTPEDLKRIVAEVSWTFQKRTSTVKQVSTLTAAGQAIGLTARELKLTIPLCPTSCDGLGSPTEPVIVSDEPKLTFSVSFPEGTSAIDWSLEGAEQEQLTPASKATSLTFSWTINEPTQKIYVSDGTYQVAAQAVDATGVIGPPISIPVRLIRGEPAAPKKVVGGFNTVYKCLVEGSPTACAPTTGTEKTEVTEFEWKANSERDVIGYRVHGPKGELVCPESLETLSTATSCIDFAAAGNPPEGEYTVVALYRNASQEVTESKNIGTPNPPTIARAESTAPEAPTNLVATKNTDGSVTLKWTPPAGGTTPVSFYRVYRGSTGYATRYGRMSSTECSSECSFTDTDAATEHEYWVTAVSLNLVESAFLGPVKK